MNKIIRFFGVFLFCMLAIGVWGAEDITLTTYYPAPYGAYDAMYTTTLGIGDNNGNSILGDNGDAPTPATDPGEVWIAGNVGIGTTNPGAKLHVQGGDLHVRSSAATDARTIEVQAMDYASAPSWQAAFLTYRDSAVPGTTLGVSNADHASLVFQNATTASIYTNGGSPLLLGTLSTERMRIAGNGNVGIGTTNPGAYKCYINGTGYLNAAAWVCSSDIRLKENISYIQSGLNVIEHLKPVKFDYINGDKKQVGFIAQEVQEILPDIVTEGTDGMLGMKTDSIIPYLVKAIQEQQKEIEALKAKLDTK